MDRITNPNQVDDDRLWTEGDPDLDVEATPIAAKYMNDLQEEVCKVIEGFGQALDANKQTQLYEVIHNAFQNANATSLDGIAVEMAGGVDGYLLQFTGTPGNELIVAVPTSSVPTPTQVAKRWFSTATETIGPTTYNVGSTIAPVGAPVSITNTATGQNTENLIVEFVSNATAIGFTLDAGLWSFKLWDRASNGGNELRFKVFILNEVTFARTQVGPTYSYAVDNTVDEFDVYELNVTTPLVINPGQRVVFSLYSFSNQNNRTVTVTFGGTSRESYLDIPLASQHNDLGGLQGGGGAERFHLTAAEHSGLQGLLGSPFASQVGVQKSSYSTSINEGTADSMAGEFTPAVTSLVDGMILYLRCPATNTIAGVGFTPHVGVVPGKAVVKGIGQALVPGDIAGGGAWAALQYSAAIDKWVLLNPATTAGTCTVQVFTVNGTYTKPAGAKSVSLLLIGGGASGESGYYGAGPTQNGGNGGAGGQLLRVDFPADQLSATCAVIVGSKGAAAAAGFGHSGSVPGGDTQVVISSGLSLLARGGAFTQSSGGGTPGAGSANGNPGGIGNFQVGVLGWPSPPGGGGGGGIYGGVLKAGGGAAIPLIFGGAFVNGSTGVNNAPGYTPTTDPVFSKSLYPGVAGGGGSASLSGPGYPGGDAGGYGAGGGGGGASLSGSIVGAGGNGAPGVVVITTYF